MEQYTSKSEKKVLPLSTGMNRAIWILPGITENWKAPLASIYTSLIGIKAH